MAEQILMIWMDEMMYCDAVVDCQRWNTRKPFTSLCVCWGRGEEGQVELKIKIRSK